jgi:hypothetical protein
LTFDWSFIDFLSCLENSVALSHISDLSLRKPSHTHTYCISWANYLKFCVCRKIFAYSILVSQLYVCIILTCYLTDFLGLDTCVWCFSCEMTNLVVFLSLFSKMFSMTFYSFLFPLDFDTIFVLGFSTLFTICPFETKRRSIFCFGPGMYF